MLVSEWRVGGIVVVYKPDLLCLQRLVKRLAEVVDEVVLINNDAALLDTSAWPDNIRILHSGRNLGVATALNLGVQHLAQRNCSHAWSFDQDSLPAADALERLRIAWQATAQPSSVAALAPQIQEYTTAHPLPFLIVDSNGDLHAKYLNAPAEVGVAITSGFFFRIDVWRALGGALEPLFIDHVDTEWCWRLRSAGWRILAVPEARIDHQLGELGPRFLGIGPRVTVRPPLRTYHMLRNGWLLGRLSNIPAGWRRYQRRQAVKIMLVAVLYGPQRWSQLKAIVRAVRAARRQYDWIQ